MPRKTPLTPDKHVAHMRATIEYFSLMTHVAELCWNTYGVSHRIGKQAERAWNDAQLLRNYVDITGPTSLPRDEDTGPSRPNRFAFALVGRGQKLPGAWDLARHQEVGALLRPQNAMLCALTVAYGRAYALSEPIQTKIAKAARSFGKLRSSLDDELCRDHPPGGVYYGNEAHHARS